MKSTELDKQILELLRQNEVGIALYDMAKMLNKNPSNLYRKLHKLIKHGFVSKIRSSITIYKLDLKQHPIVYFGVICPKCKTVTTADYTQLTKVCPNENCLTKKGERTRYLITTDRIVDKKVI